MSNISFAQSVGSIEGVVNLPQNKTLEGVNVVLKGEYKGTTTNNRGFFRLNDVSEGTHILQLSFLGYQSQEVEVSVKPNQVVEVTYMLQEESQSIDEVTIQGKSEIRKINEQAYAVTSVSAKEFYNSTSDAQQILDRVPGVRILQDGGLGSNLEFSLNGFKGDQVKFFLNGIPMDNFGSSFNLSSIPVNSIERIDVYKGVVPVWLGTDALGGAVNIITNQTGQYLDASYSIGSFNTHRASVNGAYTNNESGFTARGNVNYNYSDNDYDVLVDIKDNLGNIVEENVEVNRFHDRYRSITAQAEVGWVNKSFADQLLFGVIASGDDNQLQHGATMSVPYGGVVNESTSIIPTLKYKKKDFFIEGLDVSLNSAFNITETKNIDTLTGVRYNWYGEALETSSNTNAETGPKKLVTFDDQEFSTQFNAGYLIDEKNSLSFNYSLQYFNREVFDKFDPDKIENQFPKSITKQIFGLAYKHQFNDKWAITAFGKAYLLNTKTSKRFDFGESTVRTDAYHVTKNNFGYGAATSYFLLPNFQLKASYEHTYRLPTGNEIFGNGLFVNANPELGPEQSDNLNLGASYAFSLDNNNHNFNLGGTFIYREAKDLIFQVVTVSSPQTNFSNLAEIRTLGVEGSFNYNWKNKFFLGSNITYQNTTDEAKLVFSDFSGWQPNINNGERLPNTPYLFGNLNARYLFKDVVLDNSQLQLTYQYDFVEEFFLTWSRFGNAQDKAVIPQQNAHSIEAAYSFKNGKYNVSLECRNFTDEVLYDKFRLQKPGRAFYLKLRYAL